MKCRLCDRPTTAGTGKLCRDCAKALHRARGAALGKLPHGAAAAAQTTRAAPITLTVAPPEAAAPRSNRALLWVATAGLTAIALVYFVQQELAGPGGAATPATNRSPAAMTERVNVEPSPVATRVEEPSWTTVGDSAKAPADGDVAASPAGPATKAAVTAGGGKTGAKQARSGSQDAKSMPLPLPAEYDATAAKPAEADAQQQLAGAKVAAPAPPVDGAQVLASAMQKCGSESLLSKFICEQKTYMAYCEDKWDKDPRCMRKVAER
jgi:hypothetical protein